jgi:hypothetical protein
MSCRAILCLLALSACDRRDYEFCALFPPNREYKLRVLEGETDAELVFEWGGGPVHELRVSNQRHHWMWGIDCSEVDEDGLREPCVASPVVFPLAEAQPALVSGKTYEVRSTLRCAMGGDSIQERPRVEAFVAP